MAGSTHDSGLEILRDPRVRSVPWRDLVPLNRWEVAKELTLPLPWLIGSLIAAHYAFHFPLLFAPAACLSFVFFLTGLRVVHDAYHYNLGIPAKMTEWVIFCASLLMLGSMHAVQFNHLRHHKHCMDDEDV